MGRSRFAAAVLGGAWVLGAACTVAWWWSGASAALVAAAVAVLLAAGSWAGWTWWRSPVGRLAWDGASWSFESAGLAAVGGALEASLDLQQAVLVQWRGAQRLWLWLERGSDPARWDALRRAIYSRADDDAPSGAEPPPSTP